MEERIFCQGFLPFAAVFYSIAQGLPRGGGVGFAGKADDISLVLVRILIISRI